MNTFLLGKNLARNSPPIRRAPVPEMDWVMAMRSLAMASEPEPYARTAAALVKEGTPVIPAYSLLRSDPTIFCSAARTEGRTYGLPWSSPRML